MVHTNIFYYNYMTNIHIYIVIQDNRLIRFIPSNYTIKYKHYRITYICNFINDCNF